MQKFRAVKTNLKSTSEKKLFLKNKNKTEKVVVDFKVDFKSV